MSDQKVVIEDLKAKVPEPVVVIDSLESAVSQIEEVVTQPVEQTAVESSFDMPAKFKDKSPEEVAQAYVELEKKIGTQGNEIGALRKIADDYILKGDIPNVPQIEDNTLTQEEPKDDIDYYSEPERAIKAKVDEALKPYQEELIGMRREKFGAQLSQDHPDYEEIFGKEEFHTWLQESPMRVEMFARADRDYNYDAANELFTGWKATHPSVTLPGPTDDVVSAATLETNDNVVDVAPTKKYRRADIVELMQTNPTRYRALSEEILQAYKNGNVV